MTAKSIERIALPSQAVFFRDYVLPRRPVIITNLFAGEPIAEIRTQAAAQAAFGGVPLEVQTEYSAAAHQGSAGGVMTFDEYLKLVDAQPETRVMCTEYATPARLSAQYRLPDLCKLPDRSLQADEILHLPRRWGDHDLLSNTFLGNKGNCAHTHYDGDHRQVLLYQVFGRKRVMLFQPPSGAKLNVLDGFRQGFCNTYLENMTEVEKSAFVDYADGYDAVLEPGEAVYMPMLIWHYLEYLDTGMSVNFRFGRTRYGRFLCVDNFHRDYYIQNVSAKMTDEESVPAKYGPAIEEIKAAFLKPSSSRAAKVREMRALFRRLCIEISPEAEPQAHCPPEREEQQLALIEAELEQSLRYSNEVAADASVAGITGPISPTQIRVIKSRVPGLGYPAKVLDKVVYNRFAKPSVEALSRTEAALLIRGFVSPGAAWGGN